MCIGDRYRIGGAEFEVTQPRVTCFRVGMRLGEPELPALLVAHHRPGFYLRVLTEGEVQAGDRDRPDPRRPARLSVADVDALLYLPERDVPRLRAAVDVPALSPGWQQSFRELLARLRRGQPRRGRPHRAQPGWPGFRRLRVEKLVRENAGVTSVYLAAATASHCPPARAGQFLTLRLAGRRSAATRAQLLVVLGSRGRVLPHQREAGGARARRVPTSTRELRTGSSVEVAAPRGEFVLTDEDGPVLLISAGIGRDAGAGHAAPTGRGTQAREVWWIHSARDAAHHAFREEAHELLQALPGAREHIFYTGPDAGATAAGITAGRPNAAALARLGVPADAAAYVCGPAAVHGGHAAPRCRTGCRTGTRVHGAVRRAPCREPGVVDIRLVPPHQPPGPAGTGPEITFARSGLTVHWADEEGSLLQLADDCDVPTRFSCRTGVCHTCVTAVLSGESRLCPRAAGATRGRRCLDLLRAADGRSRPRPLTRWTRAGLP